MDGLTLYCLLLGFGLGIIAVLLYWGYKEYDKIERQRFICELIIALLLIGVLCYVIAIYTEDLYETVRCTDYNVTQHISDKGDTTYTIKYKPL